MASRWISSSNDTPLRIGCIGGGQLGRMMALEAPRLNMQMSFLDPAGDACPAASAASDVVQGDLNDEAQIRELASRCDIVTVEIEHVGVPVLEALEAEGVVSVQPSGRVIRLIQDKLAQKQHFQRSGIPLGPFMATPTVASIGEAAQRMGLPLMLKSRRGAYDGRGNVVLKNAEPATVEAALEALGVMEREDMALYAEQWVEFAQEVAVVVVQSAQDRRAYPAVSAIQTHSICRVVLAPARGLSLALQESCQAVAQQAIDSLGEGATGVFGVELFVLGGETVWLNEVAPRPHNTGHYTQDACATSQFENHLRAIGGMPLGDTRMTVGAAAMINVLGAASGTMEDTLRAPNGALSIPRAVVHWYGKKGCRQGRKMGHVNLTADSHAELQPPLQELLALEEIPREVLPAATLPLVGVIMGSSSDLPTMQAAVDILKRFHVPHEVDIVSAHRTPDKLVRYAREASSRGLQVVIAGAGGAAHLPGMVASLTPLPVIGVPIRTSTLQGQDSLLSIVQMPRGIPVATVAIGNATNAGLLAVRQLAATRPALQQEMLQYQDELKTMVENTSAKLRLQGSDQFLQEMEQANTVVNV